MKTKGIGVLNYINSVCRVCLKKETGLVPIGEVNFVHTFNTDGHEEDISLNEVLLKYCNVSVDNIDQKPQKICPGCMNSMCKAFHVFELFLQSDLFLERLLVKDEKQDDEEEEQTDITREDDNGSNHPIEHLNLPCVKTDPQDEEEGEEYENDEFLELAEGDDYFEDQEMGSPEIVDTDEVELDDGSNEIKSRKGDEEHDYCDGKSQQGETVVIEEMEELEEVEYNPEEEVVDNNEEEFDNLLEAHDLFKCRFCPTILDGIEKVIKHLKDQHLEDKRCILCPKVFRTESFLLYHVASHSNNGTVCKICALYFEDRESLEAHNNEFDHTESLACPQCKIKFPNFTKKQTHMEQVHGQEYSLKQQCETCGIVVWKHNMKKHERKHKDQTDKPKFMCQICGKCFAAKNRLEYHVNIVHEKRADLLEKLKMQRKKYKYSKKKATDDDKDNEEIEEFECTFCARKFNLRHAFLKHCMSHPEYKSVKCPYCDDVLDSAQNYRKHRELMHSSFVCDICGKGYPNKYLLAAHVNLHVRKFKCDICSKEFNRIYSLENHRRIHTGERPYKCQYCPKAFKQQAQVTQHIMTMHTEKSYKCKVCGKAFNFPYTLQAHMRSHTGEKPFGCLYCGSHFRDTVNRHKHVKQKHPERMEEFLEYKKNYQEKESKDLMMRYEDM